MVQLERFDGALTALGFAVGYACAKDGGFYRQPITQQTIATILQFVGSAVGPLCSAACKACMPRPARCWTDVLVQALGQIARFSPLFDKDAPHPTTESTAITSLSALVQRLGKLALRPAEGREERLAENAVRALGLITLGDDPTTIFDEVSSSDACSDLTLRRSRRRCMPLPRRRTLSCSFLWGLRCPALIAMITRRSEALCLVGAGYASAGSRDEYSAILRLDASCCGVTSHGSMPADLCRAHG